MGPHHGVAARNRTLVAKGRSLRRFLKPSVYIVGLIPAAWTLYLALADRLGADPVKVLERTLGLWSLRFLILGLMITPLRKLGGPNLILYRRPIGLLAFFHALLHVVVYAWLDLGFDLSSILRDILKRPYITVGVIAFCILVPLAVTSNAIMIKRIGAAAWQKLHAWVYVAATAAALHFIMLVKSWSAEPLVYAAITFILLGWRVWARIDAPARHARSR